MFYSDAHLGLVLVDMCFLDFLHKVFDVINGVLVLHVKVIVHLLDVCIDLVLHCVVVPTNNGTELFDRSVCILLDRFPALDCIEHLTGVFARLLVTFANVEGF